MSNTIYVSEAAGNCKIHNIDPYSFAEVVTPWFEEAPEEFAEAIAEAITTLADLVTAPTWAPEVDELAKFLGLNIER